MTPAQLRRSMMAGIAFIVLLVVGVIVSFSSNPDIKKHDSDAVTAAKYVAKLSDSGSRTGLLVGAYMIIVAAIAFVWFTQGLRRLTSSTAAGQLVAALGAVGAVAMATGAMMDAGFAGAVTFGDEKVPQDGDTIRVVMDLFFPFIFVIGGLTIAALIAVLALTARAQLPSWLGITAWIAVIAAIFAVIFLPMVLLLLWFLATAIAVLIRPPAAATSV